MIIENPNIIDFKENKRKFGFDLNNQQVDASEHISFILQESRLI